MTPIVDASVVTYYNQHVAHVRYPCGASGSAIARAVARQRGKDIATATANLIALDPEIGPDEAVVFTRIERQRAITNAWPGGRA